MAGLFFGYFAEVNIIPDQLLTSKMGISTS
jgi:hypothetical protein